MTLEGAIKFSENNDSIIYTMNSSQTGQYCAIIPKKNDGELSMLVDLNMKPTFDSLMNNVITKDELINKINEEYKYIKTTYPFGMLIFPMLDINLLESAINSNDKQKMFDETKKIGGITSEIYQKLIDAGIEKSKINQKITIVEAKDSDTKFVEWLKIQMPNFVDGVTLEELKSKLPIETSSVENDNPFMNVNPFTNEAIDKAPVFESQPTNNIFDTQTSNSVLESKVSAPPVETIESQVSASTNDIFGTPLSNNIVEEPENSSITQNPIPTEPQPIQTTPLSPPNIITPTDPLQPNSIQEQTMDKEEEEPTNKSGGFANLLILLVILVGVTIVSIELGKFLYNTYGV